MTDRHQRDLERRRLESMFPALRQHETHRRQLADIESGTEKFRHVFTETRLRDVDDLLKVQILLTTYEDTVAMAIANRLGLTSSEQIQRAAQRAEEEARRHQQDMNALKKGARHELQDD